MPTDDTRRSVDKNTWRLDALDEWRKDVERRLGKIESEVTTIEETRKLQEALVRAGRREHELRLTTSQKLGGLLLGAATLADLIRSVIYG